MQHSDNSWKTRNNLASHGGLRGKNVTLIAGAEGGGGGERIYSPSFVDRIWGIWGSYYNIPKAIVYLLQADYRF